MLKEKQFWQIAGKIALVGSLIVAGLQPVIVNAAQSIQLASTTQTANTQKSVAIFVDGKQLKDVNALYKDNQVWVPVLAFSKATGMTIRYTNENGWKEWWITYKPHAVASEWTTFYLGVGGEDIYIDTDYGDTFDNLKAIKGVVYAPVNHLTQFTPYTASYDKSSQKLNMKMKWKSQDVAVQKLVFAYLKDYEHVDKMNLKLYHPAYLYAQYIEKYPTFLTSIQPGKYGNPADSKVKVSGININYLAYNDTSTKAQLELKYTIANTNMPVHYDVTSRVWLSKLDGKWTVKLILDSYMVKINEDILKKQSLLIQTQPEVLQKVQADATQYTNALIAKDAETVVEWRSLSGDEESEYSKEQLIEDYNQYFETVDEKLELKEIEVMDVNNDTALVVQSIQKTNPYKGIAFGPEEPKIEKKLMQFKKMSDGRWGFNTDIDFIDEWNAQPSGDGPTYLEDLNE